MDEITKTIKKLKEIMTGVAAVVVVVIGVGCTVSYFKEQPSFTSIVLGLLGLAILSPAISFYHESIKKIFTRN
jgi:ABC-type phosphate transport system permease subunit